MASRYDVMEQSASCFPPDALGIKMEVSKFHEYADYSKRMESFATLRNISPEGKKELVEAGFYLCADGSCRCYHCGGGFRNWEAGDNPMREHAKRYPKCQHMLVMKGQTYIDKVTNGELVEEGASQNVADNSIPECEYLEMPACLSCIQMGFSKEMVLKAVQIFISKNKHSNFKGADIAEIIYEIQDRVETDREAPENTIPENCNILNEENEQLLEETTLCKVCVNKPADVLFLPCGHMTCCAQCAIAVKKCQICRKNIDGQLKAQ